MHSDTSPRLRVTWPILGLTWVGCLLLGGWSLTSNLRLEPLRPDWPEALLIVAVLLLAPNLGLRLTQPFRSAGRFIAGALLFLLLAVGCGVGGVALLVWRYVPDRFDWLTVLNAGWMMGLIWAVVWLGGLATLSVLRWQTPLARALGAACSGLLGLWLLGGGDAFIIQVAERTFVISVEHALATSFEPSLRDLFLPLGGLGLSLGLGLAISANPYLPLPEIGRRRGTQWLYVVVGITACLCAVVGVSEFGIYRRVLSHQPITRATVADVHLWQLLAGDDFLLHPNGQWIIISARDGGLEVWDLFTARKLVRLGTPTEHFDQIFLVNQQTRLVALNATKLQVWALADWTLQYEVTGAFDEIAWGRKQLWLAAASENTGEVNIFDLKNLTRVSQFKAEPAVLGEVISLSFDATDSWLAVGGTTGVVQVWEMPSAQLRTVLQAVPSYVFYSFFSPNSQRLCAVQSVLDCTYFSDT